MCLWPSIYIQEFSKNYCAPHFKTQRSGRTFEIVKLHVNYISINYKYRNKKKVFFIKIYSLNVNAKECEVLLRELQLWRKNLKRYATFSSFKKICKYCERTFKCASGHLYTYRNSQKITVHHILKLKDQGEHLKL